VTQANAETIITIIKDHVDVIRKLITGKGAPPPALMKRLNLPENITDLITTAYKYGKFRMINRRFSETLSDYELNRLVQNVKLTANQVKALWLACHTQEEISDAEDVDQSSVARKIDDIMRNGNFAKMHNIAAEHAFDFEPPIYNIWKQQTKSEGSNHFGNSESRWLDNLLYLYTKPFDIVVDPFAGGGSTIDICKKRLRRYYISDRKPIIEREKEIRQHDITDGFPKLPRWQDVKLVYSRLRYTTVRKHTRL